MATAKQKAASRRNIKKAQAARGKVKVTSPRKRRGSTVRTPLDKIKTLI